MTTAPDRYRRVCIVAGERHDVIGPDGKQVGFLKKADGYGWCYRLWGHDWICAGDSLDAAFVNVVTDHGALVRGHKDYPPPPAPRA